MTALMSWLLSGVPADRAGHAMATAAPAAELLAGNRVHLDSGLRELRVRRLVALVGDHRARPQRDDVVPVVPLIALGLELVSPGRDDPQLFEPERSLDLVDERTLRELGGHAAVSVRLVQHGQDLRDDGDVRRRDVAVAEG